MMNFEQSVQMTTCTNFVLLFVRSAEFSLFDCPDKDSMLNSIKQSCIHSACHRAGGLTSILIRMEVIL